MKYIRINIMKYLLLLGFILPILLCCNCVFSQSLSEKMDNPVSAVKENTVILMTSPELNNLTADWISEYEKLNSGVKFSVSVIDGSEINKAGTICFLSTDYLTAPANWKISIGHNVIVPVLNAKNPMLKEIVDQGISTSEFASLFSGSGKINWSDLIGDGQNKPVHQYIINNAEIKAGVSDFIQTDPAALNANLISNTAEFIAAIQKDPYAIGFCRLSDVRREGLNGIEENIRLLPIDKNGNGRMDNFESIYNSPDDLSRGVWIGKYPHALSGSIYAMSQSKPTDKNALAFLTWIMTDGGKYLVSNGYGELINLEKQSNLASLMNNPENEDTLTQTDNASLSWLVILFATIATGIMLLLAVRVFAGMKPATTKEEVILAPAFKAGIVPGPEGLYYDKTHTWTFMEKDGQIRVGIDDFLQHVTGTITRAIMKEPGEPIRRGEKVLTLTKFGKQLNLYSPISGTIKARNAKLQGNSSLVNTSPYGEGWVYLVEPKNWLRELQFMMMAEKHREWLKDEYTRLRNFFEGALKTQHATFEYAVLQDGGELRDNLLADLGPEVWEEFQKRFIDPSR
jgi:glycine cleavage system H lipoate-binding protein/ABC-type phosphate transport system substrate-binding protein